MPSRLHTPAVAAALCALSAMVTLGGCADEAECSDGDSFEGGNCMPGDGDGDGDGDTAANDEDAGQPADAGSDAMAPPQRPTQDQGFGEVCTDDVDHSDCLDVADYCAINPQNGEGSCTAIGCAEDELVCPEGWDCFNLAPFGMDLSFCTAP